MGGNFPTFGSIRWKAKREENEENPKRERGGKSDIGEKGKRGRKENEKFLDISKVEARQSKN